MTVQRTSFRDRRPSPQELDELILIELAIRDQVRLDETRRPAAVKSGHGGWSEMSVRAVAAHEGWAVEPSEVDRAVKGLTRQGMMSTDRDPGRPGADGCEAQLRPEGHARAAAAAPRYLGAPLRSFRPDDETFEGLGQIEVSFLGDRYVLGCVEGEEDRAIRFAHNLEVDAGEVLKAVTGDLDSMRAAMMAGILAHERIDEFESRTGRAPASDRVVGLDHNRPEYVEAVATLDTLIVVVRDSNSYREADEADQERRLAELEAGKTLLKSRWVSKDTVKAAVWGTLAYLVSKFADAPIAEAATTAWAALKRLLSQG